MARIRFYPEDNNLHPSDHIVGTDEVSGNGATRVFTIQALTDHLAEVLNLEVPEAIADGIIPVGDGSGGYDPSPLVVKDEDGSTNTVIFDATITAPNFANIVFYQTPLGVNMLDIRQDVEGGFSIDPLEAVDGTFEAVDTNGTSLSGRILTYEAFRANRAGDTIPSYLYTVTLDGGATLSGETRISRLTITGQNTISKRVLCIGSDTVNLGDLDVRGILTVNGVEVDLSQINTNRDNIALLETRASDLENGKADRTELHPAATLPDPTPTVQGVTNTAVTGIEIDPATQVMTITRGQVPVVIGGTGGGSGSSDFSINGFVRDGATFGNTDTISWTSVFDAATNEVTLRPNVDADQILAGVESRLDTLEDGSTLSVTQGPNTISDVSILNLASGINLTAGAAGVANLEVQSGVSFIPPAAYKGVPAGSGTANINPFDPSNATIVGAADEQLYWLPEDVLIDDGGLDDGLELTQGLWRFSDGGSENTQGSTHNWSHVANLSFQPEGAVDLAYIPEVYDNDGAITEPNKVINVINVDVDGNPTNFTEEFSLPIASEDQFGMVKLSRAVQEGIQECTIDVIEAGGSTVEFTYMLGLNSFTSSPYTPTTTSNKVLFADYGALYTGSTALTNGVQLQWSDFDQSQAFVNSVGNIDYWPVVGIINESEVADVTQEVTRVQGDPHPTGVYLIRKTGVQYSATVTGYPVTITELEIVDSFAQPLNLNANQTYEFFALLGYSQQETITTDAVTEETCIEVTAPLIINKLVTRDGVEYDLGGGGGTLKTHFEQLDSYDTNNPPDPVPTQVLKLGDTVTGNGTAVGEERFGTYMFVGMVGGSDDQTVEIDGNTPFRTSGGATLTQWLRIGAGGSSSTVSSGITQDTGLGAIHDTQVLDTSDRAILQFNAANPATNGDYVLQATYNDAGQTNDYLKYSYEWVAGGGGVVNQSIAFTANMVSPLELDHPITKDFYQVQVYDANKNMILPNNIQLTSRDDNGTTVPTVTIDFGQTDGTPIGFAGTVVVVG